VLSAAVWVGVEVRAIIERASGRSTQGAKAVAPWVDAVFEVALRTAAVVGETAVALGRLGRPVVSIMWQPPVVPVRLRPQTWLDQIVERGRSAREQADRRRAEVAGDLVMAILDEVLDRIDLTKLVLDRVNIADIVASMDINEIAAQIDIGAIVDRVPIDRVIDRIDLNEIAAGLDVNAVAARLDIGQVLERIDLTQIANQVIAEVDLPEIIRESSGAMASETMVGMRIRGIEADERVNRVIDRLLLRRRNHNSVALAAQPAQVAEPAQPAQPAQPDGAAQAPPPAQADPAAPADLADPAAPAARAAPDGSDNSDGRHG
jgi:hypothetical protein